VIEVKYFVFSFNLFGGEAGHVIHEIPKRYIESLCISAAPLLINSIATLVVGFFANAMDHNSGAYMFAIWLGMSFGAHSFPSNRDMNNVRQNVNQEHYVIGAFSHALYYIMVILNVLKVFWLDFVWAFLLLSLTGAVSFS
jgi:hypothetical protein